MLAKKLDNILNLARDNKEIKEKLIATEKANDPMTAFCKECENLGYNITVGELIALGQNLNDSKMRSVNGGGAWEIEGWDDIYQDFIHQLKWLK